MWTTLIEEPYEPRSELHAARPAAAKPAAPAHDPEAGPVLDITPAEWHGLLLTTLAPFREAREAMIEAIRKRLEARQPVQ